MAQNNLRVIYQNWADTSTVTASSTMTGTGAFNLKKDTKSLVWRSNSVLIASLTVNFGATRYINGVVLPFTNLTSAATMLVTVTGGDSYNTGAVLACPYAASDTWDSTYLPVGANMYSYGAGNTARVWFPRAQGTGVTILISDLLNPDDYLEASRLVIGDYWSPKFNTGYGMSVTPQDLSSNTRTEAGNLVTTRGIRFKTMQFDLSWLAPEDRTVFLRILKSNGLAKPLLVSLFPDCTEDYDKEQTYQIYGKLSQLSDISHPMFGIYSSNIELEEV